MRAVTMVSRDAVLGVRMRRLQEELRVLSERERGEREVVFATFLLLPPFDGFTAFSFQGLVCFRSYLVLAG